MSVALGADAPVGGGIQLQWISGSTKKLQQLLGDYDKQLKQPTITQTFTRFGVRGADLGSPFGKKNRTIFLFGDTIGSHPGDAMGFTQTDDPDNGVELKFYTSGKGDYLAFKPDGRVLGGFELPLAGITIGDESFVSYKDQHTEGKSTDVSHLARWDGDEKIVTLRKISALPEGKFIKMALHVCPPDTPLLPEGGPWILMWGAGKYRESDVYFAMTPAASFASGAGTLYFASLSDAQPRFVARETNARAVAENGTVGDVSVTYVRELKQWIMLYDSRTPRGVVFRHAAVPWGPFSEEQTIFSAKDGLGAFIHDPARQPADGLAGPVIGAENKENPEVVRGGAYAPYAVQRWTKLNGNTLTIYFLLSTWNPYTVVLMRSDFSVER
jgi:hypothetical protein